MDSVFRAIVLFAAVITIIFWSVPYFDYVWLSEEQMVLLDQGGLGAYLDGGDLIYWGTLAVWLVISAGLFFFVQLAKPAFIAFYVLSFITTPLFGIHVLTSYEMLMSNLLGLTDGIIVAMLLFTSVGSRFAKSS